MSEFWYYAEGSETRGPIAFDQLIKLLSKLPTLRGVLVWREGFDDWTAAECVREIAEKLIRPPPLPSSSANARSEERFPAVTVTSPKDAVVGQQGSGTVGGYQQQFGKIRPELPSGQKADTRGRITFLIVFVTVILVGAYFTKQVYGNSPSGIANVVGQLFGTWFLLTLLTWWLRKSPYTAAIILAVSALSVGGANMGKLQDAIAVRDGKAALQGIADPKQINSALGQNPSNQFLQFVAIVNKAAEETNALVAKMSDEIEPPSLSKDIDFGMASRKDLEILRGDAKVAEDNVAAFMPRYRALLKAERDKVEGFVPSLHMEKETIRDGLAGVDSRHAKSAAFSTKMMLARADFYHAYGNYLTFLIKEYGTYNVFNGQFSFPRQPATDQYNVVANALATAAKRVTDLETERKSLMQSQQEGWERFVKDK